MTKAEKLLQKIRNNPKSVTFDDLDKILLQLGFTRRQPKGGSSHYVYTFSTHRLTVPYRRPHVKEVYVRQVLDLLDQIMSEEASDSSW